jgi:hypothetical protein
MRLKPIVQEFGLWLRRQGSGRARFNCFADEEASWIERSRVAVEMAMASAAPAALISGGGTVIDLGAGAGRLEGILAEAFPGPTNYAGFDLHPQSARIQAIDVRVHLPAGPLDVVFCLGLVEYLKDLDGFLSRLGTRCAFAVISYSVADGPRALSSAARRRRGWRLDLSGDQFLDRCARAGFGIMEARRISGGRTLIAMLRGRLGTRHDEDTNAKA